MHTGRAAAAVTSQSLLKGKADAVGISIFQNNFVDIPNSPLCQRDTVCSCMHKYEEKILTQGQTDKMKFNDLSGNVNLSIIGIFV